MILAKISDFSFDVEFYMEVCVGWGGNITEYK